MKSTPERAPRDYMLRVRMSRVEKKMLEAVASKEGFTASQYVRAMVRRAFADGKKKKR